MSRAVEGPDNTGGTTTRPPVQVAGVDGSGNVKRLLVNSDGSLAVSTPSGDTEIVVGNVASGVADSGNPVKVGGKYNATPPTLADLQRGDLQLDSKGDVYVAALAAATLGDGANALGTAFGTNSDKTNANSRALAALSFLFNGASSDRARTPNVFKSASATSSGNTALWTPTSGKKFRLMALLFDLTENVSRTSGAVTTFSLQDATGDIGVVFDVFIPTTAVTTGFAGYTSGWMMLGNGILSALANNVLNINLSAALATGVCRVTCCGTEE